MKLLERTKSLTHTFLNGLKIVLVEHVPIFILMMLYFAYGFYIEYRLDNYNIINLQFDTTRLISNILLINFIIFFTGHFLLRVIKDDIQGIYYKWYDIIVTYFCFNRLSGFIIIFGLIPIELNLFDSLKMCITDLIPFYCDVIFMKLDYILHFNNHPWVFFLPILTSAIAAKAIDLLYQACILQSIFLYFGYLGVIAVSSVCNFL